MFEPYPAYIPQPDPPYVDKLWLLNAIDRQILESFVEASEEEL
jgi:hypothetical protein